MRPEIPVNPLVEPEERVVAYASRALGEAAVTETAASLGYDLRPPYENEPMVPLGREISSFRQYARHQLDLATRGLADPADVRIVKDAVMQNLRGMLQSAGQSDEQLGDLYPIDGTTNQLLSGC
jgi:hypothetical protein